MVVGRGPPADFVFLVHSAENEHYFWLEMWTTEVRTALLASVLEQVDTASVGQDKNIIILRVTTPRPPRLSSGLATILATNARRFERTPHLSGTGSSLNASKDLCMK